MTELDGGNAVVTDVANSMSDFSVSNQTTDGAEGNGETRYTNTEWTKQLGYYLQIPELKAAIDAKSRFTVGKGYTADPQTEAILDNIKGIGSDTFNRILFNMDVVKKVGGDSFAEIILDDDGNLANLKPLSPETMVTVANSQGIIIRYEQVSRTKKPNKRFQPHQILHLINNRVADEIHGRSDIDAVEQIILMRNEAMNDYKRVMHRNVDPVMILHSSTDSVTKNTKIKTQWDEVKEKGETWVVPKDNVVPELLALSPNATLSPLSWIQQLNMYFFQAINIPEIVVGGGTNNLTEGSVKIAYFAFQQVVVTDQLDIEEALLLQLNLEINLEFPASLSGEAFSDKPKENAEGIEPNAPEIQTNEQAGEPNDTKAELEGNR